MLLHFCCLPKTEESENESGPLRKSQACKQKYVKTWEGKGKHTFTSPEKGTLGTALLPSLRSSEGITAKTSDWSLPPSPGSSEGTASPTSMGPAIAPFQVTAQQSSGENLLMLSMAQFSRTMFKNLGNQEINLASSPMGAWFLLVATSLGAQGNSKAEITSALNLPKEQNKTIQQCSELLSNLQQSASVTLRVATRLSLRQEYEISPEFRGHLERALEAQVDTFDPAKGFEVIKGMNNWVAKQTAGKIQSMFSPQFDVSNAHLIMVNTSYFLGTWLRPFDQHLTEQRQFHLLGGQRTTHVPTMNQEGFYMVAEHPELDCSILELPYKGKCISMCIVLPNAQDGITDLIGRLDQLDLEQLAFKKDKFDLYLPKFKIESKFELVPALQLMGVKSVFDPKEADLSGMTHGCNTGLAISNAFQQAVIEVNEVGTEASAATSFCYVDGVSRTPRFECNHPFLVLIRDVQSNCILFLASVFNPDPSQ